MKTSAGIIALVALTLWWPPLCMADEPTAGLDVPFEPTHPRVAETMLKLAHVKDTDIVYDLGCGDGRIVVMAAARFGARGLGVDIDPQRIKESRENAQHAGVTDRVEFKLEDIVKVDLSTASVVTLYLLNSVNRMIRPKLFAELRPGTRVVSHAFHMADWESDDLARHSRARNNLIYLWIIPARVGGTWRWNTATQQGETAYQLFLEQEFQAVRGVLTVNGQEALPIRQVSLVGKQLTFTVMMPVGQQEVNVVFQGAVEGETIQGTQDRQVGPTPGKAPWKARRDPVDLGGRWHIELEPGIEQLDGVLRIEGKDPHRKATYLVDGTNEEIPVPAFYVWGASVRFEVPSQQQQWVFTGSLNGNAEAGKVTPDGSANELLWSAKRLGRPAAAVAAVSSFANRTHPIARGENDHDPIGKKTGTGDLSAPRLGNSLLCCRHLRYAGRNRCPCTDRQVFLVVRRASPARTAMHQLKRSVCAGLDTRWDICHGWRRGRRR